MLAPAATAAALVVLMAGCAGRAAHVGPAGSEAAPVSTGPGDVTGTWIGSFHEAVPHTTAIAGDFAVEIHPDGTFTASGRGLPASGAVRAAGNRVVFDADSGERVTLARSGHQLYGVVLHSMTSTAIVVQLERTRDVRRRALARPDSAFHRLCQAAGGTSAGHTCHGDGAGPR
jgi:hypothetical protein